MEWAQARQQLLAIYAEALQAVAGDRLVAAYLAKHPLTRACCVVAIGKAAELMAWGAQQALDAQLLRGLLITKHGYLTRRFDHRWQTVEAGHPLPDGASLRAGQALLDFLHNTPEQCELLFLISGGTSALVEVLPPGTDSDTLQRINQWLLASGLDIAAMNRVRKGFSSIKAGRLVHDLRRRATRQLLLSDVPGSDPKVIGSGLLVAHEREDIATAHLPLPHWLAEVVAEAPPLAEKSEFAGVETHILANNATARHAAAAAAQRLGLAVVVHEEDFQGSVEACAHRFTQELLAGEPALHIWGGEATLVLPPEPGRGGRCQQLALAAARELAHHEALLLAAGTDGSDGPGEDAGALVDGESVARGELEGFDVAQALCRADAGSFLEASGDLIVTGPTGSNVMDLVLGLKPG